MGADSATFMIADGAANPAIIDHLYDDEATFTCLLTGELGPDLQETAPYLVALRPDEPFTRWVLENGFGNH